MRQAPDAKSYAAVIALAILLGGSYILAKIAVREATPIQLAGLRTGIGFIALSVIAVILRPRIPRRRVVWAWCLLIAVIGIVAPLYLLAWAAPRLPSGIVGIFAALIPLFVLPLSHVLSPLLGLGERMTPAKTLGLAIGALGAMVLVGVDTLSQLGSASALAQFASLGSSFFLASTAISMRAMPKSDQIGAAWLQIMMATAMFAPMVALEGAPIRFSGDIWAALIALGLGSSAIALVLRGFVNATAGPVFMSITNYLVPLTAVLFGWAFLGEVLHRNDLIAAALILTGVAVSRGALGAIWARRPWRRDGRRSASG